MTTFTAQSVSPTEATYMAMGFGMGYAEKTVAQKIDAAWKLADSFDKHADAYAAKGDSAKAKDCRKLALDAANRAVRYSA